MSLKNHWNQAPFASSRNPQKRTSKNIENSSKILEKMTEKTLCNQASKITENWKKTGRKIWLSLKHLDPFLTVTLGSRFLIENIEKWPKTAKNDQKSRFLSGATKGFGQFIPPIGPKRPKIGVPKWVHQRIPLLIAQIGPKSCTSHKVE